MNSLKMIDMYSPKDSKGWKIKLRDLNTMINQNTPVLGTYNP